VQVYRIEEKIHYLDLPNATRCIQREERTGLYEALCCFNDMLDAARYAFKLSHDNNFFFSIEVLWLDQVVKREEIR